MKPRRAYSGGPPGGSTTSAGLFLRAAATGGASGVNATPDGSAGPPTAPVPAGRPLVSPIPTTAPTSRPSALHTFDYGQSCKSVATPTRLFSEILGGPILKRLPWSVTCLSPMRQGELLATQNPDGSLVFSAVLKDEQGLLSFLLVPPSPPTRSPRRPSGRRRFPALGSRRPVGRRLAF